MQLRYKVAHGTFKNMLLSCLSFGRNSVRRGRLWLYSLVRSINFRFNNVSNQATWFMRWQNLPFCKTNSQHILFTFVSFTTLNGRLIWHWPHRAQEKEREREKECISVKRVFPERVFRVVQFFLSLALHISPSYFHFRWHWSGPSMTNIPNQ